MRTALLGFLALLIFTFAACAPENYIPYKATDIQQGDDYITALLTYTGSDTYYLKPTSPWITNLNFTVKFESDNEFQVTITDTQKNRFNIPYEFPFPHTKELPALSNPDYKVDVTAEPFSYTVTRKSTGEVIFDTSYVDFVYSDLYIQVGTKLPSMYLYGLGERRRKFLYQAGVYTIYNKDQFAIEDGTPGHQLYGTHPVYLMREASKKWHMVLFRNINPMDVVFDIYHNLTFKTIGGIVEFKFFLGDGTPEGATKQYHNYANGWALTPFWAHGWHQSRWGYHSLDELKEVVANYTKFSLPIDTIWSDIDYLHRYQDFTVDEAFNPPEFKAWITGTPGLHWVPILDPGIAVGDNPAYFVGLQEDIFITSPNTHEPLLAKVWPGYVHYPDFNNPKAHDYWGHFCQYLHDQVPFSGLWIDMNELSNFCNGECNVEEYAGINSDSLPYVVGGGPMEVKSVSLGASHYGDILEKDFHNINGLLEGLATRNLFKERLGVDLPLIISRSTSVGSGALTQHWTGDIFSLYEWLALSISDIFNSQLYGMPFVGADICGFLGDTTPDLCARWTQLGVLYPFARNHNNYSSIAQEPWALGDTVLETARVNINFRYSIIKWYYSIFVRNGGTGTVFRPMLFEFPEDDAFLDFQTQVMIGSELLVVPCLTDTADCQAPVTFPANSKFYDFKTFASVHDYADDATTKNIDIPLSQVLPIFIQAGSIVPTQDTTGVNSTLFLDNKFTLVIALKQEDDTTYSAHGNMLAVMNYSDEAGVAQKCIGTSNCLVDVKVDGKVNSNNGLDITITFSPTNDQTVDFEENIVNQITYAGVKFTSCKIGDTSCNTDYTVTTKPNFKVTSGYAYKETLTKPSNADEKLADKV